MQLLGYGAATVNSQTKYDIQKKFVEETKIENEKQQMSAEAEMDKLSYKLLVEANQKLNNPNQPELRRVTSDKILRK